MKVYRYLSENELNTMLENQVDKLGRSFCRSRSNTHKYKKGERYIHFFKNFKSLSNMRRLRSSYNEVYYYCEFDIPMLILMAGRGLGYYNSSYRWGVKEKCIEYIVPSKYFKKSWLVSYIKENKTEDNIIFNK